ncbi:uncharacterized protein LOC130136902 [Syzygium oleosum]|uniref:uncharacterized protein LOC130136902 n=1 Tax=Syzygium oleosum TaxID=219896 RepID=UPI0024B9C7D1|nr:uncharacterized protein LOC130136902 [Syzygium oleosum]
MGCPRLPTTPGGTIRTVCGWVEFIDELCLPVISGTALIMNGLTVSATYLVTKLPRSLCCSSMILLIIGSITGFGSNCFLCSSVRCLGISIPLACPYSTIVHPFDDSAYVTRSTVGFRAPLLPHPSPNATLDDDDDNDAVAAPSSSEDKVVHIPWLEELRKLRVAELQQEVQRYDVSIPSLQLKVKKLEEEREESLREKHHKPNMAEDSKGDRSVKDKKDIGEESGRREALAREGSSGQGREALALARARGRRRRSELGQKQRREVEGQEHPGR